MPTDYMGSMFPTSMGNFKRSIMQSDFRSTNFGDLGVGDEFWIWVDEPMKNNTLITKLCEFEKTANGEACQVKNIGKYRMYWIKQHFNGDELILLKNEYTRLQNNR